jgi:hypothetical protein
MTVDYRGCGFATSAVTVAMLPLVTDIRRQSSKSSISVTTEGCVTPEPAMRGHESLPKPIQPTAGEGRDLFFPCRFVIPALLVLACTAAVAAAALTERHGGYYLGIYSDLTPLLAVDQVAPRIAATELQHR